MYLFFLISIFILGTIIGSFLNVVILRYNTGLSLAGRSGCFSCGKTLRWYELVPILSFIMLRGRCSGCKAGISRQYPLVELATGILFGMVFLTHPSLESLSDALYLSYHFLVMSLLVVITAYDMRHKIIPDGLVFAFILLGLIRLFATHDIHSLLGYPSILDLLAGPLLFLPFFLLWFFSKGTWMGFGDAKLALGMGFFMGFADGASSVVLGFWIGALLSLLWMGFSALRGNHGYSMKSEIPFAPYLIMGMLAVFFFHIDVLGLRLFFAL